MSWINIGRAAKVVALVGFLMPWLVVSCQNQPIASATGWEMATGAVQALGGAASTQESDPAWWAILALALIVAGLAASVLLKSARTAALMLAGCAGAALILCAAGMNSAIGEARGQMANRDAGDEPVNAQMQAAMAEAVRFEVKYGYWITLIGLALGAAAGGLAAAGRGVPVITLSRADPPAA